MNDFIVETKDLSRIFSVGDKEISAVDGVNLQIGKGEFVSIMGPSGSGKTTLLNLIGCLDYPSHGSILFEGQDISQLGGRQLDNLRLRRMGFIFQTFNLMPTFTALENVTLPMEIAGVPDEERVKRAKELLARLGLAERASHKPRQLSAGESQRVAIARALANNPSLLLADEPTGNLDPATSERVFRDLMALIERSGVAALIATHNMELAQRMHRVLRLEGGRLVELGQGRVAAQ